MLAKKPKYAAGLDVPVCELQRADMVKRGDWVVLPYGGEYLMQVILSVKVFGSKAVFYDTAVYPSTDKVLPWRTTISRNPDDLVHVLTGKVS